MSTTNRVPRVTPSSRDSDVTRVSTVLIERFDSTSPSLAEVVRIYVETWSRPLDTAREFVHGYAAAPGFLGLVALIEGRVIGMGFGASGWPGNWWFERVTAKLGEGHPALTDAWSLVELAVEAPYRSLGIGGMLHDRLITGIEAPRALLSTEVSNRRAIRFYERRGWRIVHPGFRFAEGQAPYLIMGTELR